MILYPQLLKHNNVTLFWKIILERIAIGDAPFGTHVANHILSYSKKGRFDDSQTQQILLQTCSSEQIVSFFEKVVGLNLQYVYFDSWKEIKRKVIKDNLIQDYVSRFQKEYALSSSQMSYLSSMIHLYLTLKQITPDDIILETIYTSNSYLCTRIKTILGIYYCTQDKQMKFSPHHKESIIVDEDEELISSGTEEEDLIMNEEEDLNVEDENIE
jgi:hypothetical protein